MYVATIEQASIDKSLQIDDLNTGDQIAYVFKCPEDSSVSFGIAEVSEDVAGMKFVNTVRKCTTPPSKDTKKQPYGWHLFSIDSKTGRKIKELWNDVETPKNSKSTTT